MKGTGESRNGAEFQANTFSPARMLLFGPNSAPSSGQISPSNPNESRGFESPSLHQPVRAKRVICVSLRDPNLASPTMRSTWRGPSLRVPRKFSLVSPVDLARRNLAACTGVILACGRYSAPVKANVVPVIRTPNTHGDFGAVEFCEGEACKLLVVAWTLIAQHADCYRLA